MENSQENFSSYSSLSPSFSSPNPDPLSMDPELWLLAEQRTQEILCTVQPNIMCDKRRKEVINYLRTLIIGYFATEVLAFGSVPLKTYLPDGDIDLTAFSNQYLVEDFAGEVYSMLEREENSEFQVKDVQYINAQVKVVKCTVKNIPVDISFNQMAGLCTLCFMEQVDRLIGRDHLFKRSILLIKAWFYYESRILGAHRGLISTYALETLVLYIVNYFHGSLRGPLEVFYKFLEYYSTFDWSNYCITINGPVALSSLAEGTAEGIHNGEGLLLSVAFLSNCKDLFSVAIKAHEVEVHEFPIKRMNILDPLNDKNNLGRCVGKGNFHRIMCALSRGALKLAEILSQPGASMGEELEKFFVNTLDRNGRGERPDALVPVHAFGIGKCEPFDLTGDYDSYYGGLLYTQLYNDYALAASMHPGLPYSYAWDENALTWTLQPNESGFFQGGTDAFYPVVPFYYPNTSQLPATNFGIAGTERSRGTGTYIPDMTLDLYKDVYDKKEKKKNPGPTRHPGPTRRTLRIKSAQKSDQVDNPTATGKGKEIQDKHSSPPDLSLEQFPVLKVTSKSNPPAISEYGDCSAKTAQLEQCTSTNPASSYPSDSTLYSAVVGVQKKEEIIETCEEKRISRQHYDLVDDKDFPPLAI